MIAKKWLIISTVEHKSEWQFYTMLDKNHWTYTVVIVSLPALNQKLLASLFDKIIVIIRDKEHSNIFVINLVILNFGEEKK